MGVDLIEPVTQRRQFTLTESGRQTLEKYIEDGHTQREIATAMGIHESMVSYLLSEKRGAGYATACRLARLLSLPLEEVWNIPQI